MPFKGEVCSCGLVVTIPVSDIPTTSQYSYVNRQTPKKLNQLFFFSLSSHSHHSHQILTIHDRLILILTSLKTIFLIYLGIDSFFQKATKIRPLLKASKYCIQVFIQYLHIQSYYFISIINQMSTIIIMEKRKQQAHFK